MELLIILPVLLLSSLHRLQPLAPLYIPETYPYVAAIPIMVLYYDDKFTVRPVPDKAYKDNY
jgi:hypothetical protein